MHFTAVRYHYIRYIWWHLSLVLLMAALNGAVAATPAPAKNSLNVLPVIQLTLDKLSLKTYLALDSTAQTLGLSNIKDDEFSANEAMLFVYPTVGPRRFWMKDTYFNLDIIFCNEQGKITAIASNMPANQSATPASIPTTSTVPAQYILEVKAGIYPWKVGMLLPILPSLIEAKQKAKAKDSFPHTKAVIDRSLTKDLVWP